MNIEFKSANEKRLFQSKTPAEFIELSRQFKNIPAGRKSYICKHWKKKNGYGIDDIKYARNRNGYWKARKMDGVKARNKVRNIKYNYQRETHRGGWPESMIKQFLKLNRKDKDGKYINKDFEVAREMEISIQSVQSFRRKMNILLRAHGEKFYQLSVGQQVDFMSIGESSLRQMYRR